MRRSLNEFLLATLVVACSATATADEHTYGDWVAKVAPDPVWEKLSAQGVVDFALTITTQELKDGAPSGEMFADWSVVCRRKSGTPWNLVLVAPDGMQAPTLTVNFDGGSEMTVSMSGGDVVGSDVHALLAGMRKGSVMNYRKQGAARSISLRGIAAALDHHLDACPD